MTTRRHTPARIAILLVLLAAAALRLTALDSFPPGLHFDEAVYGLMAQEIVAGARPVYFPAYTGREPLYMYVMAGMFALVGPTAYGIRLTSAFAGIVTVALAYALARALGGRRVGLATAALVAVSFWHVTVSRNGYPNILIPPIEAASAYWLWRGWRRGLARDWAAGGALAGLVLYTYLAARFYPVFLAALIGYAAVADFGTFRRRLGGLAVAVLAAAAVFAPLGIYFWQHPADFVERANQVLAWQRLSGRELVDLYAANIARTFGGLVVPGLGDPRWHYNLPGRAVFEPVMAAFFVVGIAICVRRLRDLRYAIPLLWIAVLSMPGILTDELQPAGQRIFGVFPALMMPAAIGLVAAVDAVGRWVGRAMRGFGPVGAASLRTDPRRAVVRALAAVLAVLAIGWDGLATVRDYFGDWVRRPETAHIFNADYVAMARGAARDIAAGRTVVLLSEHYKHPTVVFLAPETADWAVWAEPRLALPMPVRLRPDGSTPDLFFYRLTAPLPDDAPAARWLDENLRAVERTVIAPGRIDTGERDDVALGIVRYQVIGPIGFEDEAPITGEAVFNNGEIAAALAGAAPSSETARDDPLVVPVDWVVRSVASGARGFALHLRDAAGTTWAQADSIGYLAEQWQPGDRVRSWFTLDLDRAMPPDVYDAHLMLVDGEGRVLPWVRAAENAVGLRPEEVASSTGMAIEPSGGLSAVVARVRVTSEGRRRVDEGTVPAFVFDDGLAVVEHAVGGEPFAPGSRLGVDVTWAKLGRADASDNVSFVLLNVADASSPLLIAMLPIAKGYPPRDWEEREVLRGRYGLLIPPNVQDGRYRLQAVRWNQSFGEPPGEARDDGEPARSTFDLDVIEIAAGERLFEAPATMRHPAAAMFDEKISLLGYDIEPRPIRPGAALTLTLYWRAIETPATEGKVFAHLFGPDGVPIAQHDGVPAGGTRPTTGWLTGEVIVDRHVVAVPAGADVASLDLGIGIYDPESLRRWTVDPPEEGADGGRVRLSGLR